MMAFRRADWALFGRRFLLALIWLGVTGACVYLNEQPLMRSAEHVALRERFEAYSDYYGDLRAWAKRQIVLVPMSDATFDPAIGGLPGPPVPRSMHAQLVRDLTRAGARAIVFDIIFDAQTADDKEFARAARESGRVVWACVYENENSHAPRLAGPNPQLLRAGYSVGHINQHLARGQVDTIRAWIAPRINDQKTKPIPALSLRAAGLRAGTRGLSRVPVDGEGKFRITFWTDEQDGLDFFPSVSYEDVIDGAVDDPFYKSQNFFRDKIVIVGDITTLGNDFRNTPTAEQMPGMDIQAHATTTALAALQKGALPVHDAPSWVGTLLIALGAALSCRVVATWKWAATLFTLFVAMLAFGALNLYLFAVHALNVPLVAPMSALVLAALITFGERATTEEREKNRVKGHWQRHVDPEVARFILKYPDRLAMGETREATVLFADIRGFTRLSSALPTSQTLEFLNDYLGTMTDVVKRHGGTLDKYVGDAIMAVFGLPMPYDDHAVRAVRAAIEMQDAFSQLRARWQTDEWRARDLPDFDIGIGVNTGQMLCGELGATTGAHRRADFTVIGDAVNVAAHIEALTKELQTRLLIGETTFQAARDHIDAFGPLQATIKHGREIAVYDNVRLQRHAPEVAGEIANVRVLKLRVRRGDSGL